MTFMQHVKKRRSRYRLSKESALTDEALQALVGDALLHAPTPFNAQSGRVVLALGEHHDTVWDTVIDELKPTLSNEQREKTQQKIDGFKNSYGTILFFEDEAVIEKLQTRFSLYKEAFSEWSKQAQGMLQYIVWTALSSTGMGASLQHYNPLIDHKIKAAFKVPDTWRLKAQMPFGIPVEEPDEKDKEPLDRRLKIYRSS